MHHVMGGAQARHIGRRTTLKLLGSTGLALVSIPIVGRRAHAADNRIIGKLTQTSLS